LSPVLSETPADKKLILSWEQFHSDARKLAALLQPSGPFSTLVAITRGGLAPAAIVARELEVRCVETISIASYVAEGERGACRILKPIAADLVQTAGGGKMLVIDDLADTGETLKILRGLLPSAHIATLYVKPAGKPLVDTYVADVPQDVWIYFPWDLGLRPQPPLVNQS
jgi:xanthine phosphoribosyltransferase